MQDIGYTFDNASNVTGIVNNAGGVNTLGGTYGNTYKYDALHRLVESYGGGDIGSYNTNLSYSPSGRLMRKSRSNNSVTLSASVEMAYGYCDDYQPHAVRRIYDSKKLRYFDFHWDGAGNLGQVSAANVDAIFESGRFLYWTEDSRMHAAVDDRYYSYYAYDHSGERRLKLTGQNDLLDVNADFMSSYTILTEPTLYPSAYMVLTNKGYTNVTEFERRTSSLVLPRCSNVTEGKHYYAGTERVAARLGGGGLNALCRAVGSDEGLQTKADLLFGQSFDQVNSRVLQENNLHCIMGNEFATEVFGHPIDGIPNQMKAGTDLNHDLFKDMVYSMLDDSQNGQENEVYFYHSDHLGSASWITDVSGVAVQHIQYLPYGEPYVNQRMSGYNERFTFTGKERDEETGYGYFGARYMDHELMTMWLSVDPLADKYPSINPYAYCVWNPVRLVDPDGRDVLPCSDEAYEMILKSIPVEARAFVQRNSEGYIDRDLINLYSCESQNFNDLKELVNMDDCTIEVSLVNNYEYKNNAGENIPMDMSYSNPEIDAAMYKSYRIKDPLTNDIGLYSPSTGESGEMGITLRPTSTTGRHSTNGNIQVYINEKLSVKGQVENFAHEFFGHAYIYATTRSATLSEHDYDTKPGTDSNIELKIRIKRSQNEAAGYN